MARSSTLALTALLLVPFRVHTVDTQHPVTAVTYAGGGFRALSAALGFQKALEDTGLAKDVSLMGSNSGGSWFSSLLNFDTDFYNNIVNPNMSAHDSVAAFLTQYLKASQCHHSLIECGKMFIAGETVDRLLPAVLPSYLTWALDFVNGPVLVHALELGWEGYVSEILGSIATQSLSQGGRTHQHAPDLLLAAALPTRNVIVNSSCRMANISSSAGSSLPYAVPVGFSVSTSSSEWFSPSVPTNTLKIVGQHADPVALAISQNPSVGLVASASSCLPGSLVDYVIDLDIADVFSSRDRSDLAVCTEPGSCHLPESRLLDGGWNDNTAVALTVGKLQQKHGLSTTPRILAVDSVNMDLFALFGHYSVLGSNQSHVFAGNFSKRDFTKHGNLQYFHKVVQTVSNPRFGVQSGQNVNLFVVLAQEDMPKGIMISKSSDVDLMASYAEHVRTDSVKLLQDHLVATKVPTTQSEQADASLIV